ncbi:MAG: hypothetical protein J5688_01680 [Paludibacteraceae bacterium]|nr:hypothetical protein [Paludibacteraceae bacterium]
MKTTFRILLALAICFLAYICVDSVVTPIQFEETRVQREEAVVKNLIHIRTAEVEFKNQHGRFMADPDSLLMFLKTAPKKEVLKEGSLTDAQLEKGLTEPKAVKLIDKAKAKAMSKLKTTDSEALYAYIWANDKDIKEAGLQGFRRDTIERNMIETLYKGEFDENTIDQIVVIPFSDNKRFEIEVNDEYKTSQGIHVPLFEARAPFETYLADQDKQELVNLIDKEQKLDHYAGLKVGSIEAPNNNAGNWE